jgi:hypothetical protein
MRIGGFALFNRTNSKDNFNLASWHSPHSLTWRWILSLRRHQVMWPKPHAHASKMGLGAGLGQLLAFYAYRDNNGLQWSVSLFWHGLAFSQQRPMWFKDMARRHWDEAEELKHENHKLRRQLDEAAFLAARQANNDNISRLN